MSENRFSSFTGFSDHLEGTFSRRQVLARSLALGLSVPVFGALLAACGEDDDDSEQSSDPGVETDTDEEVVDADEPDDEVVEEIEADDDAETESDDEVAAAAEDDGTEISVRVIQDVETVDPAHIPKVTDYAIGHLIYNGLMQYEPGGVEVIPDLATDWEVTDDGLVYTFELREGVQFHHGYGELVAEDVVYSYNRVMDPDTASRFIGDMNPIQSVDAVGDYTVEITLNEAFSPFLVTVVAFRPGFILKQEAVEDKGDNFPLDPIGTGPYQWDSRTRGTEIVVTRNPDYFEPVEIHTVKLKNIEEDSVAQLALQTGDLDVGYFFEPEVALDLLGGSNPDVETMQLSGYRTQWAGFNFQKEAVQDVRVRQAVIHAIDKTSSADAVAGDLAQVVSSIFNPNIPGYIDPDPFPYDPDRAMELLDEAGYGDGLDLDLLVIPSTTWPDLVVVMQEQWRQVGINVNLMTQERSVYDDLISQDDAPWDMFTVNLTRADAHQYASYFLSGNIPGPNYHRYDNPEVDDVVAQAASSVDPDEQIELWEQFQQIILVDDVVGFGMTNINQVMAWNNRVSGVDFLYFDCFPAWQMSVS